MILPVRESPVERLDDKNIHDNGIVAVATARYRRTNNRITEIRGTREENDTEQVDVTRRRFPGRA